MTKATYKYTVPRLVNNRGTLPIRRSYKGVGEIRVASGTTDPTTYVRLLQMLDELANVGNLGTLASIKSRAVSPMEALSAVKAQGVHTSLTGNQDKPIRKTIEEWLDGYEVKDNTKRGYRSHLAGFYKKVSATDTVRDIPERLEQFRKLCQRRGIQRSFNHVRTALLAFARSEYKRRSHLYEAIRELEPLPVTQKLKNEAVEVSRIAEFTKGIPAPYQNIIWGMCYSGMRIGEFYEAEGSRWEATKDRLNVFKDEPGHGNKGYTRTVPLPFPLTKPERSQKSLRRVIAAHNAQHSAKKSKITPHTFRKCFVHWCSEAGIPLARRKAYVGHAAQTITDIYEKHDVDKYLGGDADALRKFIEESRGDRPKAKRDVVSEQRVREGMAVMNAIRHGNAKLVGAERAFKKPKGANG